MSADEAGTTPVRVAQEEEDRIACRPKVRLASMDQIDRRTKAAQLALEAKNDIIADLGCAERLSTLERLACEHAAMSSAVTADAYARWLKGENIALTEISTVQNAFLRLATALGFSRRAKDITPDLTTYLREASATE
jgi:hypothetical protein